MNILDKIDQEQMRFDLPEFRPGDTIKVHIRIIMKKLKVHNRTEVIFKLNEMFS